MAAPSSRLVYRAGDTPVHQLDSRIKLAALLAFSIVAATTGSWAVLGALAVLLIASCVVGKIPAGELNAMLAPVYVLGAFSVVFNLAASPGTEGLFAGLFLFARMAVLVAGSFVVCLTTSSSELLEAFTWAMSPLRRAGAPVDDIAFTLSLSLRFIPVIERELARIRTAQLSRGAGTAGSPAREARIWAAAFAALFVGLFRHADVLAHAMDARCYGMAGPRTKLPR